MIAQNYTHDIAKKYITSATIHSRTTHTRSLCIGVSRTCFKLLNDKVRKVEKFENRTAIEKTEQLQTERVVDL